MENKRIKGYKIVTRERSIGQVVLSFFFCENLYNKFQSKNKYSFSIRGVHSHLKRATSRV